MIRTRVGYAGGTLPHPTYARLGDHSETLQLDYDPARVSYEQLLSVFWASHGPGRRPGSRQYMSIIFFHDDSQRQSATASAKASPADIRPYERFYRAEDYHQKYFLQARHQLLAELQLSYPDFAALVDSTAAARINGYAAGGGDMSKVKRELPLLGLSERGQELLIALVH